jgi:hypothetical protein
MDLCPPFPTPGRIIVTAASRLSNAPNLRICRICIQSCALPPPFRRSLRRSRYLPSLFHVFPWNVEGKNLAACWRGGHYTNLTLLSFSYCNASCTITCEEGHRGIFALTVKGRKDKRRWVQVEYQDNYVKCNAGYQKRKGGGANASMRERQ